MSRGGTVYLVDDEPGMLKALTRLLTAAGFVVRSFLSSAEFQAVANPCGCLILDVAMPGVDGMELQQQMVSRGYSLPIIFVTGHGDIPMSVRAIKSGAVDFLTKPVKDDDLIGAVKTALELSSSHAKEAEDLILLRKMHAGLTPREREVMAHVISGKPGKQIAADLGTVEQTIKIHRMRLMRKMRAQSIVELVHIAARLGIRSED